MTLILVVFPASSRLSMNVVSLHSIKKNLDYSDDVATVHLFIY